MDPIKEKLIANLYSLRAGLSLISLYNSKLKQMKKEIIQPQEEKLRSMETEYAESVREGESFRSPDLEDKVKNRDYLVNKAREEYKRTRKRFWSLLVCVPITAILMLAGGIGLILATIISIIILIALLVRDRKEKNKTNQSIQMFIDACDKYQYACNKYESAKKSFEEYIEDQKSVVADAQKEYATRALPYIDNYKVLYTILTAYYSDTIFVNDWKSLDLIIFYLLTGRTDTIKESLQQIDSATKDYGKLDEFLNDELRETHSVIEDYLLNCFKTTDSPISQQITKLASELATNHVQSIKSLGEIKRNLKDADTNMTDDPSQMKIVYVSATDLGLALDAEIKVYSTTLFAEIATMQSTIAEISKNSAS